MKAKQIKVKEHSYAGIMASIHQMARDHGPYDAVQIIRKNGCWEARIYFNLDTKDVSDEWIQAEVIDQTDGRSYGAAS